MSVTKTFVEIRGARHMTERGHASTFNAEVHIVDTAGNSNIELCTFDMAQIGAIMGSFMVDIPAAAADSSVVGGRALTLTVRYSPDRENWFDYTAQDETGADLSGANVNVAAGAKKYFVVPFKAGKEYVAAFRYLGLFAVLQASFTTEFKVNVKACVK